MCSSDVVVVGGVEEETKTTATKQDAESRRNITPVLKPTPQRIVVNWGPAIGATSLGLVMAATSVTMPHYMAQRDAVGCGDSLCHGSMASLRSACSLVGAVLTGKVSDALSASSSTVPQWGGARKWSLWLGVAGTALSLQLALTAETVADLRTSVVPAALLQQNFSVLKTIVAEYYTPVATVVSSSTSGDRDRATSQGLLGMAAGLSMMVGPALGAALFPTYLGATRAGFFFLAAAAVFIFWLPVGVNGNGGGAAEPTRPSNPGDKDTTTPTRPKLSSWRSFLDGPSVRSPPAIFLLTCRSLSTLSFHIFQTIWMVALKDRFHFQSAGYGSFMSIVGLFLALSQGSTQMVLDRVSSPDPVVTRRNRVRLLASCFAVVGMARFLAYQTDNIMAIYGLFAVMVSAMGISTTIYTADSTHIAAPNELGSFFGWQSALEQIAGIVGPLLGGALSTYGHKVQAPLTATLFLNAIVVIMILTGYDSTVLLCRDKREKMD